MDKIRSLGGKKLGTFTAPERNHGDCLVEIWHELNSGKIGELNNDKTGELNKVKTSEVNNANTTDQRGVKRSEAA